MNYNSSTCPLQQISDEILFQISPPSSISFQQHHTIHHQHTLQVIPPAPNYGSNCINDVNLFFNSKRDADDQNGNNHEEEHVMIEKKKKKKIIHRDVERRRRQEMTALCKRLLFLLPSEYLQGKRSISDQMSEVINYIKQKEEKIKELSERRQKLEKIMHSNSGTTVMVQPCGIGVVEVVISSSSRVGMIPLSTVLELLVEEGLCALSCVSTTINETSIHTIQSKQASSRGSVEISGLQQKLMNLVQSGNGTQL